LLKKLVDLLGALLKSVLHVYLAGALAGECRDEVEFVAENLLVFLHRGQNMCRRGDAVRLALTSHSDWYIKS
jgi:hypothetical protein